MDLIRLDEALDHCHRALALAEEMNDRQIVIFTTSNIGNILYRQGRYEPAAAYFKKAAHLAETIGDRPNLTYANMQLGNTYRQLGDFALADQYYQMAIPGARDQGEKFHLGGYLCDLAELRFLTGRYPEARAHCDEALACGMDNPAVQFRARLQRARIDGRTDPSAARDELTGMLEEFSGDERAAEIYFALCDIDPSDEHRACALALYQKLHRAQPNELYLRAIKKLNGSLPLS
ncbi:MAG: tetratricopeptide repeat protein [Candidatus Edwardsbacteria bacterium]|nr:tetratricopeptide repeat protein [Candidatus Edwardsbacteria bacterium]